MSLAIKGSVGSERVCNLKGSLKLKRAIYLKGVLEINGGFSFVMVFGSLKVHFFTEAIHSERALSVKEIFLLKTVLRSKMTLSFENDLWRRLEKEPLEVKLLFLLKMVFRGDMDRSLLRLI